MSPSLPGARARRRLGVLAACTALVASGTSVIAATQAFAAATGGVGASLPYVEVQAENSATTGTVIGPNSDYGTLPDEASYRKAVTLNSGQSVTFTTPTATNSIVFRYSIPDGAGGAVYTAPLSLYINGVRSTDFTLTDAYSWYYGPYPFTNSPGSNPHHFYDELNRLFPTTYPAGTTFKLQADSGAAVTTIDFADFENVGGALAQPAGSVSVTSKGADATGAADSTAAFNAAITAAGAGGSVFIPEGTFKIPGHLILNNVTITGAGMWRSRVVGAAPGFYGNYAPNASSGVHLADFAIFGDVQQRDDSAQVNGIGGALNNSTVDRIWIEHEKVGAWMDGPFTNLVFSGMRIRNTTADGINFHNGITNSRVTNSDLRNLGDDGLATWAEQNADVNDSFDHNTVQYPILANGIAIYGGHDNFVTDNRVIDAGLTQGGGIHVAQRFASTTLGRTDVLRNTLIRDGGLDPNWQFGVGALWFDARDGTMTGLTNVDNILIQQSPYEAIQFVSGSNISNVKINNATIQNTGTFVVQEQVGGAATITNSTATGTQVANIYSCSNQFTLTDGGGNSGIFGTAPYCGPWPTPTFPPYLPDNTSGISVSPSTVGFPSTVTGSSSAPQPVSITNTGSSSAAVSGISTTGDFSQTNNCGSSLAAGASCTANVTFTPTVAGTRSGTLVVNAGGASQTVQLSGTATAPGPFLTANPGTLTFGSTIAGSSSAAQNVTVTNTGTTTATVSGVTTTGDYSQTNNCAAVAVNASCTVSVTFTPTVGGTRTGTLTVNSNANNTPTTVSLSGTAVDSNTNIALNKPATANSSTQNFVAANAVDGSTATYWEGSGAYPQWLQVDLGSATNIGKVVVKLPPATAWATRTQTYSVQTSLDGTTWNTVSASAGHVFDPATGNTNTVTFAATSARYVRLSFTANTGATGGQAAELEVYPSGGTTTTSATLNANPGSLTFASQTVNTTSGAQSVTVSNSGNAAAAVSSVTTSGDFAQTNTCGTSIAAGASCTVSVTFRPTASGARTGTLTVNSNATNPALSVSLSGTGATAGTATLAANPTSLTFASTSVNTSSAAQNVTITNTGSASATVSGVTTSGDFSQTNTCGTIAAGGTCSVSVTFRPTASGTRTGTLTVSSNASNPTLTVSLSGTGATTASNLAAGKPTSDSGHNQTYVSSNVTDASNTTYWESINNSWPQWVQVDLQSAQTVGRVVLKVNPAWGARTQTLSISTSTDGVTWTTVKASAAYAFDSTNTNTATITFAAGSARYVRATFTANTGWPAGQCSDFQVWSS
jgi:hypothetical protein